MEPTLENFIHNLKITLLTVKKGEDILFRKTFRHYFSKAWEEVQNAFGDLLQHLPQAHLEEVGFVKDSSQSNLKLLGFFESYDEYEYRGGIERLKKVLRYSITILGSLSKVLPGAEILKEFIEAILMGIKESETINT